MQKKLILYIKRKWLRGINIPIQLLIRRKSEMNIYFLWKWMKPLFDPGAMSVPIEKYLRNVYKNKYIFLKWRYRGKKHFLICNIIGVNGDLYDLMISIFLEEWFLIAIFHSILNENSYRFFHSKPLHFWH